MATVAEVLREINEIGGYASDTDFRPGFGDEGVNTDMSNIVVVDNLPAVPEAKVGKLTDLLRKIFGGIGELADDGGITMPYNDAAGASEGFAFIEFKAADAAAKAVAQVHNWDLDRSHKLAVMRFDAFQEYRRVPDEFVPPVPVPFTPSPDRLYWMLDEHLRDQFALRWSASDKPAGRGGGDAADMSHETEVMWAENRGAPSLDYGGEKQKAAGQMWTTSLVAWSPQGTFLTTLHSPGAKLWQGKGFREGLRLLHARVNAVLWSPDEAYVATWNGSARNDPVSAREALVVWNAVTGARVRAFPQRRIQDADPDFSWSADGKYLARIDVDKDTNTELIRVYEAPAFGLLDNRSVRAPGARDMAWCPKGANLLAYWTPERENAPTSVYVMRVPSKEFARVRPLQNVESVEMQWHPQGDYLAVISEKLTRGQARKKKAGEKATSTANLMATGGARPPVSKYSVELFRVRTKDVPIEVLDIEARVHAFAWEPVGSRFAVMQGDGSNKTVAFYNMPADRGVPSLLFTLDDRPVNSLHWSPRGDFIVLAGFASHGGALEFYDVERRKSLASTSHDVANGVAWDPSGRLVATTKTQHIAGAMSVRDTVGNGYVLWTFQGNRVHESVKPKVFQFLWRPRVEGLLTDEESKDVARNLRKYIGRYQDEDRQRKERRELLARLRKRKARDDFRAFLAERAAEWASNHELRVEAGIEPAEAPEYVTYEDVYEVVVSEEVTLVQ